MKTYINKLIPILFLSLPIFAYGQTATDGSFDYHRGGPNSDVYGPTGGDFEFTVGGGGTSNRDFNDSWGSLNFSLGHYMSRMHELALRQSVSYTNPKNASRAWNGATRLAFDQYLVDRSPWRPFIGASFGGVYGDSVRDTWAAGLEAGLKYYIQPRAFVEAIAEYGWYFRHSNNIDNNFDTGQWTWSIGTGITF